MRLLPRLLPLALLVLLLISCSNPSGILFGPPITVTPATAPISIPGITPAPLVEATASPTLAPIETAAPPPTPTPVRTPIVIKIPALTATPSPTLSPTPTLPLTPTVVLSPTLPLTPTAVLTPTSTPLPLAEATTQPTPDAPAIATAQALGRRRLDNTLNILVVGSDERDEVGPWRSDVLMFVAVDFATREVGVISFPRDLWVAIPGVGENRINTATFWGEARKFKQGGIGLLKDTLAQNFGLRVDYSVKIDFNSFQDVIDALGGIDVVVDCPIPGNFPREPGSKELVYQTLQPGEYHMDGVFALRYVRERKSTSDVDRARRQQRMLIAIRNRAREVNILPRVPALYGALHDSIETDLGLTDIIALARVGVQVEPKDAHGFIIGFQETDSWTTPEGAQVLLPQMGKINEGINTLFDQPSVLENPIKPANCRS
ncbi:MAG: LCP family protein [Caldilineales bacterium]|nr:LCP family protein [Caldilineales bacterium]